METDNEYWEEPKPERTNSGNPYSSGSKGTFSCPECNSYNTEESTMYEKCNSCGWFQGY